MREELGHAPNLLGPGIVYCDIEAQCFFDDAPNYVEAVVHILKEKDKEGCELVQTAFLESDFI